MTELPRDDDRVVYLAYGSNTDPGRLEAYITGSDDTSPFGAHGGSVDQTPIRLLGVAWLPGRLYFGGKSSRWGGGVALADVGHMADELFVVRYEMSRRQLVDLVSQENAGADVEVDWRLLASAGSCRVTGRLYDTLVARGCGNDELLLTSGTGRCRNPPSDDYVSVVVGGLSCHLSSETVDRYISRARDTDPSTSTDTC